MAWIRQAYAKFANGQANWYWAFLPIVGGPNWASSERFTIDAKAEGTPSLQMMKGPMLQALLVDGFHLRSHRETRQVPIYELAVAKGGSKLRAFDGKCHPIDFAKDIPSQFETDGTCVFVGARNTWDAPGQIHRRLHQDRAFGSRSSRRQRDRAPGALRFPSRSRHPLIHSDRLTASPPSRSHFNDSLG